MPERIRRLARAARLAGFLGLLLGYAIFYATYPNMSVPSVGEANLVFALAPLFLGGVLAGILADDVLAGVLQAFLALPIGASVASLLSLSPVFAGLIVVRPDDVVFFTLRSGFPLMYASVPILILTGVLGILVQEKLRLGRF